MEIKIDVYNSTHDIILFDYMKLQLTNLNSQIRYD